MESVATKDLMARASAAARVGETLQARGLYEEALQNDPENVEAWLGLAGVVDNPEDKKAVLEQALRVDPENAEATTGLDLLVRRMQVPRKRDDPTPAPDPDLPAFLRSTSQRLDALEAARAGTAAPLAPPVDEIVYCVNHPDTETLLRCNRCGRPVCTRCVQLTDVGYRCKDCINTQQKAYFNAETLDYPIAFAVGFIVCAFAAPILGILLASLGFFSWIIAILAGSAAGGFLAEIVRRAIGRRRGRYLWAVAFAGILLGVLVGNLVVLFTRGYFPLFSIANLLFLGLALSTTYYRLR
jgi:tetratricopeptide (TPR) repeat protein